MLLDNKDDLELKRYVQVQGQAVPQIVGNIAINFETNLIDIDHRTTITALRAFLAELWVKEEYLKFEFPIHIIDTQCRMCGAVQWMLREPWKIKDLDKDEKGKGEDGKGEKWKK